MSDQITKGPIAAKRRSGRSVSRIRNRKIEDEDKENKTKGLMEFRNSRKIDVQTLPRKSLAHRKENYNINMQNTNNQVASKMANDKSNAENSTCLKKRK